MNREHCYGEGKILFRFKYMHRFKFTENEQEAFWNIQWLT